MKRMRAGAAGAMAIAWLVACGGGGASSGGAPSASAASAGDTAATPASAGEAATSSPVPHASGGLGMHLTNVHAGGSLPDPADPQRDHLDVSFTLDLHHMGTEPLTGVSIARLRLVADDGREVVFGVESSAWDGRLEPGQQRSIPFTKTPDSAHPVPDRSFCGVPMRLEVTLDLAGRRAVAQSQHVQVQCTARTQ